jgi:hypothetical protein
MSTLQKFVDEVIACMRSELPDVVVPEEPELMPSRLPMSLVYASEGYGTMAPAGAMTYYHNVRIAFVGPLENLSRTNEAVLQRFEDIVEAVYRKLTTGGFTAVANIGDFNYSIGPDEWGNIAVYGLFLTFNEVKIQRVF